MAYYKPDYVDEFECDICCVDFVKLDEEVYRCYVIRLLSIN